MHNLAKNIGARSLAAAVACAEALGPTGVRWYASAARRSVLINEQVNQPDNVAAAVLACPSD